MWLTERPNEKGGDEDTPRVQLQTAKEPMTRRMKRDYQETESRSSRVPSAGADIILLLTADLVDGGPSRRETEWGVRMSKST